MEQNLIYRKLKIQKQILKFKYIRKYPRNIFKYTNKSKKYKYKRRNKNKYSKL